MRDAQSVRSGCAWATRMTGRAEEESECSQQKAYALRWCEVEGAARMETSLFSFTNEGSWITKPEMTKEEPAGLGRLRGSRLWAVTGRMTDAPDCARLIGSM